MLSPSRLLAFRRNVLRSALAFNASVGIGLILSGCFNSPVHGQEVPPQEKVPRSILVIEDASTADQVEPASNKKLAVPANNATWTGATPARLASSGKRSRPVSEVNPSVELVRDRFANGKVSIERRVTLDASGNFVNHGEYRQFSDKGELLVTGEYDQGQRTGVWSRFLVGTETALFKSYPFHKFRPPFASTVEFEADQMHGVWVISDRDKRVVCQVELQHGDRHGTTTLFHPNGQVYLQSNYVAGVLDGPSIEKSQEGKTIRQELYVQGRKQIVDTEHFGNKSIKSVTRFVSGVHKVDQPDDWTSTTLASLTSAGQKELHGEFVSYHDNGQLATKGSYEHGQLHGAFESWHRTGELAVSGSYHQGQQDGNWIWRHANGMKRAVANYEQGKLQGELRSWDEQGKSLTTEARQK